MPPNPLSQIPSNAPLVKQHRHREYFILAIAIVVVAAGLLWWQIARYGEESQIAIPSVTSTPDPGKREISNLGNEIRNLDAGNLENEFRQIDSDLNSL